METLLVLALLACPVGMGAMMWFMGKGMGGNKKREAAADRSLPDMKAEQARLAAKIEALEQTRAAGEPVHEVATAAPAGGAETNRRASNGAPSSHEGDEEQAPSASPVAAADGNGRPHADEPVEDAPPRP